MLGWVGLGKLWHVSDVSEYQFTMQGRDDVLNTEGDQSFVLFTYLVCRG